MTLYPALLEPGGAIHPYCTPRCRDKGTPLAFRALGRRGGSVLTERALPVEAFEAPARCAGCHVALT